MLGTSKADVEVRTLTSFAMYHTLLPPAFSTRLSTVLQRFSFRRAKIGRSPYYDSIDYPSDEALASAVEDGIASVEQVNESSGLKKILSAILWLGVENGSGDATRVIA